jgi:DNA-binding response OmpR family regulator
LLKAGCRTFSCARYRDANDLIKFASVVICEQTLPDGSWRDVLRTAQALTNAPAIIVTSRLAVGDLRAEVLNLGGYDVLPQPYRAEEVMWIVRSADRQLTVLGETGAVRPSAIRERRELVAHGVR